MPSDLQLLPSETCVLQKSHEVMCVWSITESWHGEKYQPNLDAVINTCHRL